jgi:lipopolysaccharide/colanic/teichoic acid biosynthesis glycosyltransferase
MKRVMAAGAIGAMMAMMTVIGPRGVIVRTMTAIGRRRVAYAMTCQLPGLMTKTALLARTSERQTAHRRN